jgi:hypothetical protein
MQSPTKANVECSIRFCYRSHSRETGRSLTMRSDETEDDRTQPFGRGYIVFLLVMGALLASTIYFELWV